nr:hypothetical protein [Spiroplasma taiwanense]
MGVKNYLKFFKRELNKPWKIKTINGQFTSFLRNKIFELPQKNRDDYSHHAKDAVVIALSQLIKINSNETIGSILDNVENDTFHLEGEKIDNIRELENNSFNIKREIENFNYVFTKKNIKTNNNQLFNETIYIGKKINGELRKTLKVNIFDDFQVKLLNDLFNTNDYDLFIKKSDPKTFNYLKNIFDTYYNKEYKDDKNKMIKIKNLFSYFRYVERQLICKQSIEKNPPLIKNLRYLDKSKNERYHEIIHKFEKVKNNKIIFHTSLEKIGWDIYYSEKLNRYKVVELNIKVLKFNNNNILDRNSEKYKNILEERKITNDYIFKFNISKYDEFEFDYQQKLVNYIIVGSTNDGDKLEFKYINKKIEKRIILIYI